MDSVCQLRTALPQHYGRCRQRVSNTVHCDVTMKWRRVFERVLPDVSEVRISETSTTPKLTWQWRPWLQSHFVNNSHIPKLTRLSNCDMKIGDNTSSFPEGWRCRVLSFGLWHRVDWQMVTNTSDKHTASIFRAEQECLLDQPHCKMSYDIRWCLLRLMFVGGRQNIFTD
jgi:hypothetical protein